MFRKQKAQHIAHVVKKDISIVKELDGHKLCLEVKGVNHIQVDGEEVIADETLFKSRMTKIVQAAVSCTSKYNTIPARIIVENEIEDVVMQKETVDKKQVVDEIEPFAIYEPKWKLDEVYLKAEARDEIEVALTMAVQGHKLFHEWKLKGNKQDGRAVILNFWGKPGTGKTMVAEAIAHHLGKSLLVVNYAELESKYVGETPKNIKAVFEKAREKDAVIVFDEADSFLGKRLTGVTQSADYGVNITRSVMLMELENYNGIVIFTTNLIENYDEAFKRRILSSIEFDLPDELGRKVIWAHHIPETLPLHSDITNELLAQKYIELSGADIKDIVLFAATNCLAEGRECLMIEDFDKAYTFIKKRYQTNEKVEVITERITMEQYEKEVNSQ